MAYVYQADIYCDRCGKAIWKEFDQPTWDAIRILRDAFKALPEESDDPDICASWDTLTNAIDHLTFPSDMDESTYDSDDFPQYADDDSESDSPLHCGSHDTCLDAINLTRDGEPFKVGAIIGSNLTREGVEYVRDAILERPSDELMILWGAQYNIRISYVVSFSAYCGMAWEIDAYSDRSSARDEVADYLRKRRNQGYPIAILKRGSSWEIQEPTDTIMVPDECGTLSIDLEVKA